MVGLSVGFTAGNVGTSVPGPIGAGTVEVAVTPGVPVGVDVDVEVVRPVPGGTTVVDVSGGGSESASRSACSRAAEAVAALTFRLARVAAEALAEVLAIRAACVSVRRITVVSTGCC